MLSALRTRKFTALFACFDFDKNGVLEKGDYEQFARNLSQAYNLARHLDQPECDRPLHLWRCGIGHGDLPRRPSDQPRRQLHRRRHGH
ncbi:MAG: hypothetical protein R2867_37320 [Caldilineaceae bacterium]